jgi:UDP-glucuronate decarboxylase
MSKNGGPMMEERFATMSNQEAADVVRTTDLDEILGAVGEDLGRLSGRRLLITGGAGFLGYYMVQAPLHWNDRNPSQPPIRVVVLDNFYRGEPTWLSRLDHRADLVVQQHDIRRDLPGDLGEVDFIFHAAGIASPTYYRKHPIETMDANINGLRYLLDHAVDQGRSGRRVEGFVFFSSSEIYGDPDPDHIPTPETYRGNVSCTGPRACYDESKRYGETLCVNFAGQHGITVTMARPFNNYGPGMKITDGRIIADLFRNVFEGRDLILLSDGSPTRTFCYVADAVAGYFLILLKGRPGEPYNIGADTPEVSMANLAERVSYQGQNLVEYGGRIVRGASTEAAYLVDNPRRRCPDITKARSELGFSPSVSLDEGLRRTLRWYMANLEGEDR